MDNTDDFFYVKDFSKIFSGMEYNVYCDESCHLQHSESKAMSLGAIWCPKQKTAEINKRIVEIKAKHGIKQTAEVKWTKASPCNEGLYLDLIDYFLDDDDLHFRGVAIPDKDLLDHEKYQQSHDEWYYKMYYILLKTVFDRSSRYNVYIDIKDSHSYESAQELREVCSNYAKDYSHKIIQRIQPIRSEEVQIMQLVDILTGALCFRHNHQYVTEGMSRTKVAIVNHVVRRSSCL